SMPHPLLGALLLATIGLVIFRSFIMTRMQREIIERHVREKLLRQKKKELRFSGKVQRHFLKRPPEIPGLEIAAACPPASEVSGDYYDFLPVDEDRWLFILADVAGHGVPAALLMNAAMMSTATDRALVGVATNPLSVCILLSSKMNKAPAISA
ncbi:MAG: SpoIIE family protein phosphatase, partial [Chloroflexi bacterium]|nr:SpoIIE family protein phosphatase [Chloroflexota bacterium]